MVVPEQVPPLMCDQVAFDDLKKRVAVLSAFAGVNYDQFFGAEYDVLCGTRHGPDNMRWNSPCSAEEPRNGRGTGAGLRPEEPALMIDRKAEVLKNLAEPVTRRDMLNLFSQQGLLYNRVADRLFQIAKDIPKARGLDTEDGYRLVETSDLLMTMVIETAARTMAEQAADIGLWMYRLGDMWGLPEDVIGGYHRPLTDGPPDG